MALQTYIALLKTQLQLHLGGAKIKAAQQLLDKHMQELLEREASAADLQELMLLLLAGAAKLGNPEDVNSAVHMCSRLCTCKQEIQEADFKSAQFTVLSKAARSKGSASEVTSSAFSPASYPF